MKVDDIDFEFQCDQGWNDFDGDGWCATCGKCDREVVNLSKFTKEEARQIMESDDPPCVYVEFDDQGDVAFRDPQVQRQRRGLGDLVATAAAVAAPLLGAAGGYAAATSDNSPEERLEAVAGEDNFVQRSLCDDDAAGAAPVDEGTASSGDVSDRVAESARAVSIARTAESLADWLRERNANSSHDGSDDDKNPTATETTHDRAEADHSLHPGGRDDGRAVTGPETEPSEDDHDGADDTDDSDQNDSSDTPDIVDDRDENFIAGGLKPPSMN